MIRTPIAKKRQERHPGEVWETDSGRWRGKNPRGETKSHPTRERALAYAQAQSPDKSLGSMDLDERGLRNFGDSPEFTASPSWLEEHTGDSPKGSRVIASLAEVVDGAGRKTVHFLGQRFPGGEPGSVSAKVFEVLSKKFGDDLKADTMDGPTTRVRNKNTDRVDINAPGTKKLLEQFNGDRDKVRQGLKDYFEGKANPVGHA